MAIITIKPFPKQHLAYEALKEKDIIFFGGGAGGGKSWWLCESRLINCYRFPGYKSFIGREELKRLMQSTYLTWIKVCKFHHIPLSDWKLNGQYNYIEFKNGSRVDLLDLKFLPSDPLYERFGSMEYTDGAIEEAGEVHFLAYDVLKSRIGRHLNEKYNIRPTLAISGNPKKNWTYSEFYKSWKNKTLPDNIAFIQSLYQDNPYTAQEYGKQLTQIKDKPTKERLMFGNWEYEDDPNALMKYDAILDLFTNTAIKSVDKYLIGDIARFGNDQTVITLWEGLKCYKVMAFDKQAIDTTSNLIKETLRTEYIPYSHALVDEGGVGGGVVDNVRGIKGFIANAVPIEILGIKENYKNLKTQCSYMLADKVNGREIEINCENEKIKAFIIEDLEQIKGKDWDKDQKLQIKPKEEVKELLGRSPDYGDCLVMRMYFELKPVGERPTITIHNITYKRR